jgi:hypothetical protein
MCQLGCLCEPSSCLLQKCKDQCEGQDAVLCTSGFPRSFSQFLSLEIVPSEWFSAEEELRAELKAAARRLGEAAKYRSAGTIEYLVDQDTSKFYFLEVNTRLQVH